MAQRKPNRKPAKKKTSKTPTLKVLNVSAFFANDRPGGIGLVLNLGEGPDRGVKVCRILESQLDVYDTHGVTPDFLIGQLREWADRGGMSDEEKIIAITSIYWLQERGHLTKDEYNGVIFAWTVGAVFMTGEQSPLLLDLSKAVRDGIDVTEIVKAGPLADMGAFRAVTDYARTQGGGK